MRTLTSYDKEKENLHRQGSGGGMEKIQTKNALELYFGDAESDTEQEQRFALVVGLMA